MRHRLLAPLCGRRASSQPRTRQGIVELPTTPIVHVANVVDSLQMTAHKVTSAAAEVVAPVVLAGATVVAGGAAGAAISSEVLGEAAAQTLGEWSRPMGTGLGKLAGGVVNDDGAVDF